MPRVGRAVVLGLAAILCTGRADGTTLAAELRPRIEIDPLPPPGADAAGAMTELEGGLPADLWPNTPRALVDALLPRLPTGTPSPALRSLLQRLLLTAAAPPSGQSSAGTDLLEERAWALWTIGDLDGVRRLAAVVPAASRSSALVRIEVETMLIQGDVDAACTLALERVVREPDVFWQKIAGFCRAASGEHGKAALTVALLAERDEPLDRYAPLISALGGDVNAVPPIADPSPLEFAMLRAAGRSPATEAVELESAPIRLAIATAEGIDLPLRIAAAERAVQAGVLPATVLHDLWRSSDALAEDRLPGSAGRPTTADPSTMIRSATAVATPVEQASAALDALDAARASGRYLATLRLAAPLLAAAAPTPDLQGSADRLVPALLVLGERRQAEAWLAWLAGLAPSSPAADASLVAILPAVRLARLDGTSADDDRLAAWWLAERTRPGARARAARLYALLDAVDDPLPDRFWRTLLAETVGRVTTIGPDPAIMSGLQRAAAGRRVGETVLLALVSLGEDGIETFGASGIAAVVSALRGAGLEQEARAIALEAVASAP